MSPNTATRRTVASATAGSSPQMRSGANRNAEYSSRSNTPSRLRRPAAAAVREGPTSHNADQVAGGDVDAGVEAYPARPMTWWVSTRARSLKQSAVLLHGGSGSSVDGEGRFRDW